MTVDERLLEAFLGPAASVDLADDLLVTDREGVAADRTVRRQGQGVGHRERLFVWVVKLLLQSYARQATACIAVELGAPQGQLAAVDRDESSAGGVVGGGGRVHVGVGQLVGLGHDGRSFR